MSVQFWKPKGKWARPADLADQGNLSHIACRREAKMQNLALRAWNISGGVVPVISEGRVRGGAEDRKIEIL